MYKRQHLDHAKILYIKGLYHQSLLILAKVKEQARVFNQDSIIIQAISLEKKIETLHITRSIKDRAEQLTAEAIQVHEKRLQITRLSNLALGMYGWYIKHGHARNQEDEEEIESFFRKSIPESLENPGFYEELYINQSFVWYHFIRQDFLNYYRYTKKWVNLFENHPEMKEIESGHYIKGMHNLLNAHYDLRNIREYEKTLKEFEVFASSDQVSRSKNDEIQSFVYLNNARLNYHILRGDFDHALRLIPGIEKGLEENAIFLDRHRILVMNYKFATLLFGAGKYDMAIDYLRRIINDQADLRDDLQCYARILHLLSHFELGNFDIIDSLTRSTYRFMSRMKNLTIVEEEMFRFLRKTFYLNARQMQAEFAEFLSILKKHENNRYATRAFAYLDIISWVESKVHNISLQQVVENKYLKNRHR